MEKTFAIVGFQDYADEFDYPVISILTESKLNEVRGYLDEMLESWTDDYEAPFGTNEALTFYDYQIRGFIDSAFEVTSDEMVRVLKLIPAVDIIEFIEEYWEDELSYE